MNISHQEDRELVKGFLAGRKNEHRIISKWIFRVVKLNSWGLNQYAEDITQDVLLKLYDNLSEKKFKFSSSLKIYVYRITKFTCIDYLRRYSSKGKKEIQLSELQSNNNPEQEMQKKDETKIFWRIHKLMPQECRELWSMIFKENLSYREIAQRFNIKEGTVKSRFARCKEKAVELRKKLVEKSEYI